MGFDAVRVEYYESARGGRGKLLTSGAQERKGKEMKENYKEVGTTFNY